MKLKNFIILGGMLLGTLFMIISCEDPVNGIDGKDGVDGVDGVDGNDGADGNDITNFSTVAKVAFGDGVTEISAYDSTTKTVFSTNSEAKEVEVIDISNVSSPEIKAPIDITAFGGNVNSVACKNGYLAMAIEAANSTENGKVIIFKTDNLAAPYAEITAGALPDMVTFTPDGKYVLSANEG